MSIKKTVSIIAAVSLLLSIASCDKKTDPSETSAVQTGEKVSSDFPWFESKRINIDLGIEEDVDAEYTDTKFAGVDDKYIVVVTTVYYKLLGDENTVTDSDLQEYENSTTPIVSVFDRAKGETVKHINVKNDISVEGIIDVINYASGRITVTSLKYDASANKTTNIETDIDPLSGSVLDTRRIDGEVKDSVDRTYTIGKYRTEIIRDWNSGLESFIVRVISPDGNTKETEVNGNGTQIFSVNAVLPVTETAALICAETDKGIIYYTFDLEQGTAAPADHEEYKWLDTYIYGSLLSGTDGKTYYASPLGISRINLEKKAVEMVFDYSWCNINRQLLNFFYVAECTGDSFLLCGQKYQPGSFISNVKPEFMIYEFSRAAQNPHAGKTVLELYSADGELDYTTADAVLKFNDTNSEYFIEVTDRYNLSKYSSTEQSAGNADEYEVYNLTVNSKKSEALAVDLINGKGPDILMNTSSFGLLNNPNFLADLTPYIGTLDSNKYFTNVIEGAKYDGALYQVPVTIAVDGIHTDPKYAGSSGVGFTTAEYEVFLRGALNGKDVIGDGQAVYFARLFSAERDLFIKGGKVDFTTPEFKELARYVKDNAPQNSRAFGEVVNDSTIAEQEGRCAIYNSCLSISSYFSDTATLSGATAVLGIPSSDGRGPLFSPRRSVAVSAQAKNIAACAEFVKMLLSDDVQMSFAMCDGLTVNREALKQAAKTAVDYYNAGSNGTRKKYSEETVNDLEKVILNCSRMNSVDSEINLILIEEMPAYFLGQKDLDDVIKIAQDRVQKVLGERG
ncbi:MAG: ABC transporter substrate-binding protein [Saccharofermentans sp.]|nr:ABC transporter substrate-binding protein [Saccharofermentans sp.]